MPLRTDTIKLTKMTYLALLAALAIIMSSVENVILPAIPFLPPGAKPGLSNVITMFVACTFGLKETFFIIVLKSLFVLLTRGMTAFGMSIAGGALSGIVMVTLIRLKPEAITYVGISVLAAVAHNIGQLIISIIYTGTKAMINYLPALLIFGVVSGVITGIIIQTTVPRIQPAIAAGGFEREYENESADKSENESENGGQHGNPI